MPDPLNLLSKVHDTLFGGREGPLSILPQNPLDGPESSPPGNDPPGDGPGAGDSGLDTLPRGLEGRDSIPYGVAKQLDLPAPPAPPPLPGALPNPGGPQTPNGPTSPMSAPSFGGNAPAIPTGPAPPATGGAAPPVPAGQPAIPSNSGSPLGQISYAVQSFLNLVTGTAATATTRGSEPNLPANPATARPATPNPVPPPMAPAQTAQTTALPPQAGVIPAQGTTGTPAQPAGIVANPNAANPPGANPAATAPAARAGATETLAPPQQAQQTQPQGRTDAAPVQQRPEGSLLDRLMSLLRPNASNPAQGSLAPNSAAGATQAAGATVVAMPLAVAATQAPMDPRGNVLLAAVNDRAGIQRSDALLTGIYTADGPYRRALRRGSNVMSAQFSRLLMALGLAGPPVTMHGRNAEYELSVALQWLFWLLAIVAYACLGLAVIAFLPAGSDVFGDSGRGWTTGFAVAGLFAAVAAWWFARQLSARGGGAADPEPETRD